MLARVDDSLYRRQIEIDRANLGVATAQVAVNESTLAAAQSNVSSDGFDLVEKQRDYARAEDIGENRRGLRAGPRSGVHRGTAIGSALAHDQAMVQVAHHQRRPGPGQQKSAASKLALG